MKTLSTLLALSLILSGTSAFSLESSTMDHAAKMSAGGLDKGYENSQYSKGEASVDARTGGFSKLEASPTRKEKIAAPSLAVIKAPMAAKSSTPQTGNGSTSNFWFWMPVFVGACAGGALLGPVGVLVGAAVGAAIGWSLTN